MDSARSFVSSSCNIIQKYDLDLMLTSAVNVHRMQNFGHAAKMMMKASYQALSPGFNVIK